MRTVVPVKEYHRDTPVGIANSLRKGKGYTHKHTQEYAHTPFPLLLRFPLFCTSLPTWKQRHRSSRNETNVVQRNTASSSKYHLQREYHLSLHPSHYLVCADTGQHAKYLLFCANLVCPSVVRRDTQEHRKHHVSLYDVFSQFSPKIFFFFPKIFRSFSPIQFQKFLQLEAFHFWQKKKIEKKTFKAPVITFRRYYTLYIL